VQLLWVLKGGRATLIGDDGLVPRTVDAGGAVSHPRTPSGLAGRNPDGGRARPLRMSWETICGTGQRGPLRKGPIRAFCLGGNTGKESEQGRVYSGAGRLAREKLAYFPPLRAPNGL